MKPRLTYHPGDSLLHRLHPLTKLAWLIWGTLFVFLARSPWAVMAVAALAWAAFPLCRLSLRKVRGVRLFGMTALLLFALQVAFVQDGAPMLTLGSAQITTHGFTAGMRIAGRFVGVVLMSYVFVLTTEPNALAYALMQVGLPYRWGFALVTALRLVPVFEQEGEIVYQAQLARGIAYDARSPRRFVTLARQFFLPLLISALSKVDALAVSMEGRCFGKYPQRTYLREVRPGWRDVAALAALGITLVSSLVRLT